MSAPIKPSASRRTFLGGAAALAPALALPAVQAAAAVEQELDLAIRAHQDATVLSEQADVEVERACERLAAIGGHPERPQALVYRDEDHDLGLYHFASYAGDDPDRAYGRRGVASLRSAPREKRTEETRPGTLADGFTQEEVDVGYNRMLVVRREPWPEAQARADKIIAAWDSWHAEEARRLQDSGLNDAREVDRLAVLHLKGCARAVAAATATSSAGLLRKALFVMRLYEDRDDLGSEIEASTTDVAVSLSIVRDLLDMGERLRAS